MSYAAIHPDWEKPRRNMADGYSLDESLEMFPSVQRSDAEAFLRLARGPANEGDPGRKPAQAA